MKDNKNNKIGIIIALTVVILFVLSGGVFLYYNYQVRSTKKGSEDTSVKKEIQYKEFNVTTTEAPVVGTGETPKTESPVPVGTPPPAPLPVK